MKIDVDFHPMGENRPTLESTPQRKRKRNKGGQGPKSKQASKQVGFGVGLQLGLGQKRLIKKPTIAIHVELMFLSCL